jgi:hypothetical protein
MHVLRIHPPSAIFYTKQFALLIVGIDEPRKRVLLFTFLNRGPKEDGWQAREGVCAKQFARSCLKERRGG